MNRLRRSSVVATLALAAAFALGLPVGASPTVGVRIVSNDPYTNTSSFHKTEVEPDTFSFGSTVVSAFQTGRFVDGGGSNIGWATSTDAGQTWTHGFLPGTTVYATPPGTFARISDPAVAYDPKHDVWLIVSLPLKADISSPSVLASRSTDGGLTWQNPVVVQQATGFQDFDKTWVTCDTWAASPFFGRCYAQWDDFGSGNIFHMATSTDGGLTWSPAQVPNDSVIAGQPVVQPSGRVVVPIDDGFEGSLLSYVSTNGGQSYVGPSNITSIQSHGEAGNLRSGPLPSAEVDADGNVYVVWADCRFRSGCPANDIVMSTSMDGQHWSSVVRIPIDPTSSTVDHFLPGIAVDRTTSGATTHIGVTYYYYPETNCSTSTCRLTVGFIKSMDGGASWTQPVQVVGPFKVTWLPLTSQGYMVGDYISTSFVGIKAYPVVAAARQGTCTLGQVTSCRVPMVIPVGGLSTADLGTRLVVAEPVVARSDHSLGGLKSAR